MFCRILGCGVLSIFVCLSQSLAGQSINNSETDTQSPSITHPRPEDGHISVVRLRAPRKAMELYNRGWDALRKQKLDEAEKDIEQVLKIYPIYPDALALRGAIHLELHQSEAAEQDFRASVDADPTFASAYIGLAEALNEEQRFDDALAVVEQASQLTPDAWNLQYESSRALIGKGLYDRALKVIEEALRARPARDSLLHLAKAHALAGLGKLPEAAEELRAYLSSGPTESGDEQARNLLTQLQTAIGGQ